jgi:tripartite-type tricarboxylate transporter receptor subunit TctC
VRTIDDLKKKTLTVGASSKRSTTSVAPTLINELLGTKMKVVTGYRGTGPTLVAMERSEVDATTVASATLVGTRGHWLRDRKIVVLAGLDFAEVPGAPRIRDLIKDDRQRALWDFVALPALFGTASLVAPGVPADRLAALRQGFNATVKDPAFLADGKRRNLAVNPQTGEELDALHAKHGSPTPEIVAHVARVMGVKSR